MWRCMIRCPSVRGWRCSSRVRCIWPRWWHGSVAGRSGEKKFLVAALGFRHFTSALHFSPLLCFSAILFQLYKCLNAYKKVSSVLHSFAYFQSSIQKVFVFVCLCRWLSRVSSCSDCSQSRRLGFKFFYSSEGRSCLFTRCSSPFAVLVSCSSGEHCLTTHDRFSFPDKNNDNNRSNNNSVSFVTTHLAYFFRFPLK